VNKDKKRIVISLSFSSRSSDESYTKPKNKEVVTISKKGSDIHLDNVENNLSRLNELLLRKRITKKEYEKKRKEVLKQMR
jgi:hypothetical protein